MRLCWNRNLCLIFFVSFLTNTPRAILFCVICSLLQVSFVSYEDDLAEEIGIRPRLANLLFKDPSLAFRVFFGPALPSIYRLNGPHSWKGARNAIMGYRGASLDYTRMSKANTKSSYRLYHRLAFLVIVIVIPLFFLLWWTRGKWRVTVPQGSYDSCCTVMVLHYARRVLKGTWCKNTYPNTYFPGIHIRHQEIWKGSFPPWRGYEYSVKLEHMQKPSSKKLKCREDMLNKWYLNRRGEIVRSLLRSPFTLYLHGELAVHVVMA